MPPLEDWVFEPFPNFAPGQVVRAPVTDLERAKRFYEDKLKCEVVESTAMQVTVSGGLLRRPLVLQVAWRGEVPPDLQLPNLWMTVFLGGVRGLYQGFESSGVPIATPYEEAKDGRAEFGIEDPDGNVFIFSGPP